MNRTRRILLAAGAAAALAVGLAGAAVAQAPSAEVGAAVADQRRPDADRARDADRKPAETVAFAGVKPGDVVGEINPGGGYFTRVLAATVGPTGKVYALVSPATAERPGGLDALNAIAEAYGNVVIVPGDFTSLRTPEPADVVWTTENYHDFHNGPTADIPALNKAVFDTLKPGGVFYVQDHNAKAGSPADVTSTLHRIEVATARRALTAAGFQIEAEGDVLRNPEDPGDVPVREDTVQGRTDKFMLRARKPG